MQQLGVTQRDRQNLRKIPFVTWRPWTNSSKQTSTVLDELWLLENAVWIMIEPISPLQRRNTRLFVRAVLDSDYRSFVLLMLRAFTGSQLTLAKKYHLPLFLHSRAAHDDFVRILREEGFGEDGGRAVGGRGGVVHSFTGSAEDAADYVRVWNIGFDHH
jgi:TatD related DNase